LLSTVWYIPRDTFHHALVNSGRFDSNSGRVWIIATLILGDSDQGRVPSEFLSVVGIIYLEL
jgi:hypothetical protein